MKSNTDMAKELLVRAMRALPSDFTLFEARRYVSLAIQKIESVEKKREKRATQWENRKEALALKNELQIKKENIGE